MGFLTSPLLVQGRKCCESEWKDTVKTSKIPIKNSQTLHRCDKILDPHGVLVRGDF